MVAYRAAGTEARIARVEGGLVPPPALRSEPSRREHLLDRMDALGVPGLSVAVIAGHRIEWARGYGLLEARQPGAITTDTLFQAASISKTVTAAAALRLAREEVLDLDRDVNDLLVSWSIPPNGEWQPRVTLRQLLGHSAGVRGAFYPSYSRHRPWPSLEQVLRGEPPANTPPVRINALPGLFVRYGGAAYSIVQQVLVDATGLPFPELMRQLVLEPLRMARSTFEQPLPEPLWSAAATGHRFGAEPVDGKWTVFPETASAGLWTTPSDLARLAIALQQGGDGMEHPVLPVAAAAEMLAAQVDPGVGLGVDLVGEGDAARFEKRGGNEGYRCTLVAYVRRGVGAVVMTNSDAGDELYGELLHSVAREYAWPGYAAPPPTPALVGPEAAAACAGLYDVRPGFRLSISGAEGGALLVEAPGQAPVRFLPRSRRMYFSDAVNTQIVFARDASGVVSGLALRQDGREVATAAKVD